jgi:hypothetical protein
MEVRGVLGIISRILMYHLTTEIGRFKQEKESRTNLSLIQRKVRNG